MKKFGLIILAAIICTLALTCENLNAYASPVPASKVKSGAKAKATKTKKQKQTKKTNTKARTSADIKRERQKTQSEISETRRAIDDNKRRTRQGLDRLSELDAQISRQQSTINSLTNRLDTLNGQINNSRDSIAALEKDVSTLRTDLKKTLRALRARRTKVNPLAFIFSAKDFTSAMKRYNYLSQLHKWETSKINRLRGKLDQLTVKHNELLVLKDKHNSTLTRLNVAQQVMSGQQQESQQLVNQLKREGSTLQQVLAEKRRRISQLDNELNRIIENEQREARRREEERKRRQQQRQSSAGAPAKPDDTPATVHTADEERSISGPFSSNKGRLLFPVAGRYTITGTFGRTTRNGLAIDNSGIDISVSPGTKARAVFDGTVTSVFMMPTYHSVIIIRHGAYLTVYAGLTNITVAKGQKVKTGQTLGTVFTDTSDDNRTELHFEVRHERTKLNPLQWVK